jgi:cellulose synthase (UDP-forming)
MYCLLMLAISFFMLADPLKRVAPKVRSLEELPTVDVFIPTYNEDPELLAATLAAAKSMIYPRDKLSVWLLDDGGTEAKRTHKDPVGARRHPASRAAQGAVQGDGSQLSRPQEKRSRQGRQSQ